jgi:molybdopterin molybdotransferase
MKEFIGFEEALVLTLSNVSTIGTEDIPLEHLVGRVLAEDVFAQVDCPSLSTSRKDGYAVVSSDLSHANESNQVKLILIGNLAAGDHRQLQLKPGQAARVTTGAPLPEGADAVLSEEFCHPESGSIVAFNTAETGRNILPRGRDIRRGEAVGEKGMTLTPARIGLLAAAGISSAAVYRYPRVAVIATGDEVVMPGRNLVEGQLYASNMVEICAWLSQYGLTYLTERVGDQKQDLREAIEKQLHGVDVFLTSGGAWGSERDLILSVVADLNWQGIYHRVRMGPGKPVAFGLLRGKPFFCLPGGPPSNEMAFLQLALPAILKMKGQSPAAFPIITATLAQTVYGKKGWTDIIHAHLENTADQVLVHPARLKSALHSMAQKQALIIIPEDRKEIPAGEIISLQLLTSNQVLPFAVRTAY